ncbi:YaeQ family protein [Dechloromonas sp.]|uniref:YaeQ family protein n=1 Tax=Dechloromonas sp. TaxID=1917218 RepID=UPI00263F8862|nr:YaeQ family protein [Dechloromonas sp.]
MCREKGQTDERMMVRLLAFALNASPSLVFGRGLSTEDEADLMDVDPTGAIDNWIDVGLPDEKSIRRAANRSRRMLVLSYGGRGAEIWWQQTAAKVSGLRNLSVLALEPAASQALGALAERTMRLQCTIQDGMVWLGGAAGDLEITPRILQSPVLS